MDDIQLVDTENEILDIELENDNSDEITKIPIRWDDTIEEIKEKIFIGRNEFFPGGIKLSIHSLDSDIPIILDNNNLFLFEFTRNGFIKDNKIIVENIVDLLSEIDDLDKIKSNTSRAFMKLFADIQKEYKDVTRDILFNLVESVNKEELSPDFERFIENKKEKLTEKYIIIVNQLNKLSKNKKDDPIVKKLTQLNDSGFDFNITNVLITLHKGSKNEILDTISLFNKFKLSPDVPFMSVKATPKNPFIKVYDGFLNDQTKKLIKDWTIKEKKVEEDSEIIKEKTLTLVKGLVIKVKTGVNKITKKDKYSTINVFNNGRIQLRCTWSDSEKANQNSIKFCFNSIKSIITEFNQLKQIFKINNFQFIIPSFKNSEISSINAQLLYNIKVRKAGIRRVVDKEPYKTFFELGDLKKKNIVTLSYSKVNNESISIRNSAQIENSTLVTVVGAKKINQFNIIFDLILSLIKRSEKEQIKELKITKEKKEKKEIKKGLAGISILKQLGLFKTGFSKTCEKKKQPVVDDDNIYNPDDFDSYELNFKGHRLVCLGKEKGGDKFIFPGFAKRNNEPVPCCFTTDQRRRTVFTQFNDPDEFRKLIEKKEVDKTNIIVTDKLLLPKQLGLLSDQIKELFELDSNNFLRFGVLQDNKSFINAVLATSKKETKLNELVNEILRNDFLTESLFASLQNGNIKLKFKTINNYISFIKSENIIDHSLVIELMSLATSRNIFVFSEEKGNIICSSDYSVLDQIFDSDKKTIFIIKKGTQYEPIVLLINEKIIRSFTYSKYPIVGIIKNLYEFSCISSPINSHEFKKEALTTKEIENIQKLEIEFQIINDFNKVLYLIDTKGRVIGVKPSGPIDDPEIQNTSLNNFKKNVKQTIKDQEELNNIGLPSKIISQIIENGKVIGLVLETGVIIPTIESQRIIDLPVSTLHFVEGIDSFIFNETKLNDTRLELERSIDFDKQLLQQIRLEMSKFMEKETKFRDSIEEILQLEDETNEKIKNLFPLVKKIIIKISRIKKERKIKEISKRRNVCFENKDKDKCKENELCNWKDPECKLALTADERELMSKNITIELIRDTIERRIMNAKVSNELTKTDEFIIRQNETLLFNVDEVLRFLDGEKLNKRRRLDILFN